MASCEAASSTDRLSELLGYTSTTQVNKDQSLGWIRVPEFQDEVFARVTSFPHGYAVEYVCPAEYGNLKSSSNVKSLQRCPGLFFWQKIGKVQPTPESREAYLGNDQNYQPNSENAHWYPESSFEGGTVVAPYTMYDGDPSELHKQTASLAERFGSHCTILDREIKPVKFADYDKAKNYWEQTYAAVDKAVLDSVLVQLGPEIRGTVSEWIRQKLEGSGMDESEIQKVIDQYLYERTATFLRFSDTIDVRSFLDEIAAFPKISAEQRQEMMEYLAEDGRDLYPQMTAVGKITCNPGLRQQD